MGKSNPLDAHAARMLKVTPFREMRRRQGGQYLIKHVIPGNSLVLVYGLSGSGKTFFVGYAALCIAADREFLGHKVKPGLVVYIAPENPQSVEERFAAFGSELGIEDADLVLIAGDLDLLTTSTFAELLRTLRRVVEERGAITAVVIDTVSQAMPGADENGSDGMTAFVQACQRIRLEFDCAVIAVHHAGKEESRGARGHSSLRAAVDVEIKISANEGQRVAELTKVRDGAQGLTIAFALRPIDLGVDEDGDPITTCIVESTAALPPPAKRSKPTGPNQVLVWEALLRTTDSLGRRPAHLSALTRIRAVTIDQLRDEVYRSMQHVESKHRSTRFSSAVTSLSAQGFVNQRDDWIWITRPGATPDYPPSKEGEGNSGARLHPITPDSGNSGVRQ